MNTVRPKDLRIGNHINGIYIYEDDDKEGEIIEVEKTTFCTVVSIDTTDSIYRPIMVESDANIESFERMEGIPLNEEWLLKFGFEKAYGEFTKKNFNFRICSNEVFTDEEYNPKKICKLEYVHQIQNLYFALSGEELTIK